MPSSHHCSRGVERSDSDSSELAQRAQPSTPGQLPRCGQSMPAVASSQIHAAHQRKAPHDATSGGGQRILVVDARPLDADDYVPGGQVIKRQALKPGTVLVDAKRRKGRL